MSNYKNLEKIGGLKDLRHLTFFLLKKKYKRQYSFSLDFL